MTLLSILYTPTLTPTSGGYLPSVNDVSALLHARLRSGGGQVPDTFDSTTSPTAAQVLSLITTEAAMVLIETGDLSDENLICAGRDNVRDAVRGLIAKRVAAEIELSYWPEEVVTTQTAEDFWRRIAEVDQPAVVQAAKECRMGEIEPEDEPPVPMGSFNGPRVGDAGRW